jgi:hypothetical protein
MTVTIHANPPSDLYQLIRDLQTLDGSGNPYRVRRAIHGSGAIVEDELALAWLMVTQAGQPEFLESLIRTSPELEDLVGRRASDAALQELQRYWAENGPADDEALLEPGEAVIPLSAPQAQEVLESPARKATKSEWEEWAVRSGLVSAEQGAVMTKAQLQELDGQPTQAAPARVKEG